MPEKESRGEDASFERDLVKFRKKYIAKSKIGGA